MALKRCMPTRTNLEISDPPPVDIRESIGESVAALDVALLAQRMD